jgi:hypothetical protein
MGAAAAAVGDVFTGAVEGVFESIKSVGNILESAVREVGKAVESVGREVGKIGQAAVNDPVGTIAKVAAIASGQWWALPLVSAGLVIANGGDIGQAALAAGISLAAQGMASGVADYLGAGSSAALEMATEDMANLAAEGLTAGQIAQIAAQSYPEIGASAISKMAEMAAMGIPAAEMFTEVGAQIATQNTLANIAGNATGAGARTALTGGDLSAILSNAGAAGLGTGVGGAATSGLKDLGFNSTIANAIGKGTGAATSSAALGKNSQAAFINSLINTTLSEGGKQTKSFLKTAWNDVKQSVSDYNAQLDKTNENQARIDPLYKTAKDAEDAINAELEAYKPVRQRFSDLVTQYDAAKAAGNVELANSLADQANAMIPELDAATIKYNNVYNDYDAKLKAYDTEQKLYQENIKKTDAIKETYTKNTEELTKETRALTDAAAKVVTMPEPVQNAFAKMYQSGTDVNTALENSNQLSKMSNVAQESFNRNISTSNSTESALELANKVNALDTKQQASYQTSIDQGLDDKTAMDVAPVISKFDTRQQLVYTDSIAKGMGAEGADLIAAFASFNQNPTGQSAAEKNAENLAQLDTPELKKLYRDLSSKVSPDEALRTAQGLQALTGSSVIVSTERSPIVGDAVPLTKQEINDRYLAQVNADVKANRMTQAEADKELSDLGISKTTSVVNIGTTPGAPAGPNTGLINTDEGTGGGAQLNSPNSLYTPLSFGADGAKKYYTGDGEIYSLVNINGEPTLVNDKDNTLQVTFSVANNVDPVTGQIVAKTPVKQTSTTTGGNNAPAGGTPSGATGTTGAAGSPASGTTGTPTYTPYTISDALSKYTGTADFTNGTGGTAGTPTTGPTSPTAGTTTGTGTSSATTGTGTGTSTTGTGTGSGTTGTGTGAGGTGTGTGTGSGSGSGSGFGFGATAGMVGSGLTGWQALQSQDQYGGIKNLTPGLTERMDYTLAGLPVDSNQDTVNPMSDIKEMATGGSSSNTYDPFSTKDVSGSGISGSLTPGLSKAQISYILSGLPGANVSVPSHADGGSIDGHNPQFFSEGGLGSIENRYVQGEGDGTSDSVAAMLANGEFVIPADVVSKLGNGSNEAGAGVLDQFLVEIRKHAHSNGEKLPPESKGPLGYLLDAKRKVKA